MLTIVTIVGLFTIIMSVYVDDCENIRTYYNNQIGDTLPAKNMEYFSFRRFLFYFVGCVGYIFICFTFLQADITFGELGLIHTQ